MDLNRIQGLFKTTTKIQDFFRIVRTVERVLAVRTCEKTWGGGGGETWPKVAGGNFQMENTHLSLSVLIENELRCTQTR